MVSKRFILISVLIIILIILSGVIWLASSSISQPSNIILISIDTIRADHLGCYGYKHQTTPNIDTFADNSVLFQNCFSNIPLTLPSHASMLTGVIPPTHGAQDNFGMVLSDSVLTLPEILQKNEYATYGIVSASVVNSEHGFNQGFDVFDDEFESEIGKAKMTPERPGEETVTHAIKWLEQNQHNKKFMFIHFYDPHDDYAPPAPYDTQFENPYDGEITFVDHCIGRFIDKLKSLDLYDDSLVIITGDHGELLGEHGEPTHGFYIYHNVLRVPLMIKPAGHKRSIKVKDNTTLIDIMPTILAQNGIEIPSHVQGLNLSDYFTGRNYHIADRFIFNECLTATKYSSNSLLGIINDQWHYIQSTRPELYNIIEDPEELDNLIDKHPKLASFMQSHLSEILKDAVLDKDKFSGTADHGSFKALESLGYVGGTIDAKITFKPTKEDPKDLLSIHLEILDAQKLIHKKEFKKSIQAYNQIIEKRPDIPAAYQVLAELYLRFAKVKTDIKSYDEAAELLRKRLELQPDDITTLKYLSQTYDHAGDYSKAIDTINAILKLTGQDPEAYLRLAEIYSKLKSYDKAAEMLEKRLALIPDDINTLKLLANFYSLAGNYHKAINSATIILELKPDETRFYEILYESYIKLGFYDKAADTLKRKLQIFPNDVSSLNNLGWHLATHKDPKVYDPQSALMYAQKAVALASDKVTSKCNNPGLLDTLAAAQAANGQFDAAIENAARAVKLCQEKNLDSMAVRIQSRLDLYKQHKTYRE
jgi:choline-sulfatase